MILVIGGAGQGKLCCALNNTHFTDADVCRALGEEKPVLDELHLAVRAGLAAGKTQAELFALARRHAVVICDEIGCGVVPIDTFEREWREVVGRICCELAKEAGIVARVYAGIPTLIKGEARWN